MARYRNRATLGLHKGKVGRPRHPTNTDEQKEIEEKYFEIIGRIKVSPIHTNWDEVQKLKQLAIKLGLGVRDTRPVGDGRSPPRYNRRTIERASHRDLFNAIKKNPGHAPHYYAKILFPEQCEGGDWKGALHKVYIHAKTCIDDCAIIKILIPAKLPGRPTLNAVTYDIREDAPITYGMDL